MQVHPLAVIAYRTGKLIEFQTAAAKVKAARTHAEVIAALREADQAWDALKQEAQ